MVIFVTAHAASTSGWEIATAVGTIAAAVATFGAIVAAFVVGAKDRRAADDAQKTQIQAAEDRLIAEHRESRQQRRQEHEIELLLSFNAHLANFAAYEHADPDQSRQANHALRGLGMALPTDQRFDGLHDLLGKDYLHNHVVRTAVQDHLAELIRTIADR